ncbi:MAG: AMP-binding protein [Anaerolineales bacterium]|nr:AMP-binding protein [Anaerolineales bacterium]MCB8954283.1 AMP-binding protein [Ardenticatenales bacterium]
MTTRDEIAQRRAQLSSRRNRLSPEQKKAFEAQLAGKAAARAEQLPRRAVFSPAPLSLNQQRLWFLYQWEPESHAYNIFQVTRLHTALNMDALQRSFDEVVRRHEVLRTTFNFVEGQPAQLIAHELSLFVPVIDLRHIPMPARDTEARRLSDAESKQPFDLTKGPLIRLTALWLDDDDQVLLLTMHHIISDGWSVSIFVEEAYKLYQAYSTGRAISLPALPIQYADFAVWQRQQLTGEPLQEQLRYWKKELAGAPSLLALPIDYPRPPVQSFRGKSLIFQLDPELSQQIKQISQQANTTLFMTMLASFSLLLSRYSRQEHIVIGTPVGNRHYREIEPLIGFFVNTLVLCTHLSGNPTFWELLERVRQMALSAHEHRDFPFEMLVQELQRDRDVSHNPLFQVMLLLDGMTRRDMMQIAEEAQEEVRPDSWEMDNDIALFDLLIGLEDKGTHFHCSLTYNTGIFERATVSRMVGHFQTLLANLMSDPTQRVLDVPLLTAEESERLVLASSWQPIQEMRQETAETALVHTLIAARAEQSPDAIAIVTQEEHITYRELNERANRLAHYLLSCGVGPDTPVAIWLDYPENGALAMLAVLKAGGCVLPFADVAELAQMPASFRHTSIPFLITEQHQTPHLPAENWQIICLDRDWRMIAPNRADTPTLHLTSANLACAIPATDAQPARLLTHREINLAMTTQLSVTPIDQHSRVFTPACRTSNALLAAVLPGLQMGATLCLYPQTSLSPKVNLDHFVTEQVVSTLVLSSLQLNELSIESSPTIKHIITTDRVCPLHVLRRWLPGHSIYNAGRIGSAAWGARIDSDHSNNERPIIGHPIPGRQAYLLDARMQPVPVGVPAELYIEADSMTRGYAQSPRQTASHFVPHPFAHKPGSRLFKTGEIACRRADGILEFVAQTTDLQEIRGRRVEPGQIESILGQHPDIKAVHVRIQSGSSAHHGENTAGDPRLVAYVVLQPGAAAPVSAFRAFLKERLPVYMHPAVFILLDALPLAYDGQVARTLLPSPDTTQDESDTASQSLDQSDVKSEVSQQRAKLSVRESELSEAKKALLLKRLSRTNAKRK